MGFVAVYAWCIGLTSECTWSISCVHNCACIRNLGCDPSTPLFLMSSPVLISSRTQSKTQHTVTANVLVQSPAQHERPTGHEQWHVRFLCTGDGHERRHVSVREASLPAMRAAPLSQGAFENHDAWACKCVQTWRGAAASRRIERAHCELQRMPAAHPIGLSHLVSRQQAALRPVDFVYGCAGLRFCLLAAYEVEI